MTEQEKKAAAEPPLDCRVGLTEYLDMVSDYWSNSQYLCERCDMNIEQGYCAMLHDSSVPDGNCFALAAIGVYQPGEVPND